MREKSLLFVLFIVGAFMMSSISNAQDRKTDVNTNKRADAKPYIVSGPTLDNSASTLSESFESATYPPAGWLKLSTVGNVARTWIRVTNGSPLPGWTGTAVTTTPPGGGTAAAYVSYGDVAASNNEWLMTPQITNVQPNDSLSFWVRYIVPNFADSMSVYISTTTQTVAAMTTTVWSKRFFGAADTGWVQYKFRLGSFVSAGANIYIGFREHVADNLNDGSAFELDLVNVTAGAAPPPPSTWWEQTTPVTGQLHSVSAVDNNVVWACGVAGRVIRTTNGGTWVDATGTGIPASLALYNIWGINATTALVTGSSTSAFVYKTTDAGATWTQVFTQVGGFINVILMSDANNGWMEGDPVANRWSLWRTTNGGATWDSTGRFLPVTGSEAGWNNSAAMVGNNIWFGTNNTKVYYSSNAGVNWTAQPTTGVLETFAVSFNNASTGFTGGASMLKSTNNGSVWTSNTILGTGNVTGITHDGDKWWYTRQTGNGIYYSSNNGTVWAQQHTGPVGATYAHITRARTGFMVYAVRSNGGVSKYGPTTGVEPVSGEIATDYKLSQNYPNPFNPATKINFSLPKGGMVTLKVYDILGKEVATLVNEFKATGTYAVDFNASNLSSGIYLYKIQADGFVSTKRMMLVK